MTDCNGGFMSDLNSEYYIPDSSIQASSELSSFYIASRGRLHASRHGWLAHYNDNYPWIQADLGRLVNMYGIQTQGSGDANWVTTLKVSTSQVPGAGDAGDFIKDWNEIKVCNV